MSTETDTTDPVEQAKEYLEKAEQDFEYLSDEEIFGTIRQAIVELEIATDPTVCDGCGREVTLMGNGRCGHCQPSDSVRDSGDSSRSEGK